MKSYINIFNQYFKRFDVKDKNILLKFHHSYRVMEYAKEIGKSLHLSDHDIWLCAMIGLFHDIGRFKQWTEYHTFFDKDSIDHGNLSYEILKNENILKDIDIDDKNIILMAIKYHNKYDIREVKDERTLLFCKIIRDADKLDILVEQNNSISKVEKTLSKELLKNLYDKNLCQDKYIRTDVDFILRQIGFIFDLNFMYSYQFLLSKNWFENKFNLLENYVEDISAVKELEYFINRYVKERSVC